MVIERDYDFYNYYPRYRYTLPHMYYDNYRYGTGLYSGTIGDIESRYRGSLAKTYVGLDRRDLTFSTFAGSGIIGRDRPLLENVKKTRWPDYDLYAPITSSYSRPDRTPQKRSRREVSPLTSALIDYDMTSIYPDLDVKRKYFTEIGSDGKKRTTTTTYTYDRWIPLSTYLYTSPTYYSTLTKSDNLTGLNLTEDYKYKKSTDLDALNLHVGSYSSDKFDFNYWTEKCREIQRQLDFVNQQVADAESKIKSEITGPRSKMQAELTELNILIDDTTKYNEELQRVIKRQARQITDLQSNYQDIERHLSDATQQLEQSRRRTQSLSADLQTVRTGLEHCSRGRTPI